MLACRAPISSFCRLCYYALFANMTRAIAANRMALSQRHSFCRSKKTNPDDGGEVPLKELPCREPRCVTFFRNDCAGSSWLPHSLRVREKRWGWVVALSKTINLKILNFHFAKKLHETSEKQYIVTCKPHTTEEYSPIKLKITLQLQNLLFGFSKNYLNFDKKNQHIFI